MRSVGCIPGDAACKDRTESLFKRETAMCRASVEHTNLKLHRRGSRLDDTNNKTYTGATACTSFFLFARHVNIVGWFGHWLLLLLLL